MDDIFNKKIDELIIKFANEYPISYASEILCYMFDELNSNNFIIKLCNEIWKYTPSTILTYDELMDASILAQLSYNTHLLFLSLPDICDYPNEWTKNFKLNQIQLGIIWLTAFIIQEATEMATKWQDKDLDKDLDQNLLNELAVYYRNKIINRHKMVEFSGLSNLINDRRAHIAKILYKIDNEYYSELLYFFNVLCVVKKIKIPSYQKDIIDNIELMPYYLRIHPTMTKAKTSKKGGQKRNNNLLNSNKVLMQQLFEKYNEICQSYLNKKSIGIPFQ
jgi:hypothetical protein